MQSPSVQCYTRYNYVVVQSSRVPQLASPIFCWVILKTSDLNWRPPEPVRIPDEAEASAPIKSSCAWLKFVDLRHGQKLKCDTHQVLVQHQKEASSRKQKAQRVVKMFLMSPLEKVCPLQKASSFPTYSIGLCQINVCSISNGPLIFA